ncbi:MAG: 2-keto-4-pentenoate hydratase [Polaromonas sp.]|nr:2-keto-4-pentenoate hydratase [Polaromonas sp.]
MKNAHLQAAIDALVHARLHHSLADAQALRDAVSSAEQAYGVQQAVADRLSWFSPDAPQHWKSGGPAPGAELTHARLPEAGIWPSPAACAGPFALRGIEAEIALRLAVPVDARCAASLDPVSASRLVDAMAVSIEVVDSRWSLGLEAPALLKLADLQSHGALVLGNWVPFDAAHDWSRQPCRVQVRGAAAQEFCGTHSLGNPAYVLPALLRHATHAGQVVPAGSVVTTGTWCGVLHARQGDQVTVFFEGIGEARIDFSA